MVTQSEFQPPKDFSKAQAVKAVFEPDPTETSVVILEKAVFVTAPVEVPVV